MGQQAANIIYECQRCHYYSAQAMDECLNCGHAKTFRAVQRVLHETPPAQTPAQYANQYAGAPVVFGCRNLACSYRSEQWSPTCPHCGKSIRTEAELKNLARVCGLIFMGVGGFIILIGVWVVFALFQGDVKTESYWAVAAIFAIGSVFALGGLSGIKGHWWLLRLLIGFAR